jgi:lysophospholipase L1-like esterase
MQEVFYGNHALMTANYKGSVDAQLLDRQILICDATYGALYSKEWEKTDYVQGSRPELEKIVNELTSEKKSDFEKVIPLMRLCRDLYKRMRYGSFYKFGGTEENLIEKGEELCECLARLMVSLCEVASVPGRIVTHIVGGHLTTELFIDGKWTSSQKTPVPNFVGCDRLVKKRVAYLGDSITQGIGTSKNSYRHWNAVLSDKLGDGNAYWNLGIGFARSGDASSDGSWLNKAKMNDVVFVCLGVNDILKGKTADEVCGNLDKIVIILKENGVKVILQSVPPFDYNSENKEKWNCINKYIETELKNKADLYFDCVPVLSVGGDIAECAKYGGHPNEDGCEKWAEALYEKVKDFIGGTDK